MSSLSLNSLARSRCVRPSPRRRVVFSSSVCWQKSSTWQNSSSRLMVGCLSVRGNVEDNTSFERHPALSITHVVLGSDLRFITVNVVQRVGDRWREIHHRLIARAQKIGALHVFEQTDERIVEALEVEQ